MKLCIYILCGISFAAIGWNLSQLIIDYVDWLKLIPEVVQSSCVAASLSVGTVLTEIFLSNPTRFKLNLLRLGAPVATAAGLGFFIGLIAGGLSQILLIPFIRNFLFFFGTPAGVRIVRWMIIGIAVGLAEGLSWGWRSVEAGNKRRSQQRLKNNLIAGMAAGFIAAIAFEFLRLFIQSSLGTIQEEFKQKWDTSILGFENFLGLLILGCVLGVAFRFATSPSYVAAFRAGTGFEYNPYEKEQEHAKINKSKSIQVKDQNNNSKKSDYRLEFVSNEKLDLIEEGLSIQLPEKGTITIGSSPGVHICIPGLPRHIADLDIEEHRTSLIPNTKQYKRISIDGKLLDSPNPYPLKHNSIVAFFCETPREDDKKMFRFVFYNRFLDPEG